MRLKLIYIIFYCLPFKATTQNLETNKPDDNATYPGGLEGLYKDINQNLNYPIDAMQNGIEGKLFVEFTVTSIGEIQKGSVRTIISLYPSCDLEAERVIKSLRKKWIPAQKFGTKVSQVLVLPVAFKLTDSFISESFIPSIATTVKPKPAKAVQPAWDVYSDLSMNKKIGTIAPGDSIEILGWAPWLFAVKSFKVNGYISYRAPMLNEKLKPYFEKVEIHSERMEKEKSLKDSLRRVLRRKKWSDLIGKSDSKVLLDSIDIPKETYFFRILPSKKKIVVGECTVVDLSLYLKETNRTPLQFDDLGVEISNMNEEHLQKDYCWRLGSKITDVVSQEEKIAGVKYFVYTIFKANYCPIRSGIIDFGAIPLKLKLKLPSKYQSLDSNIVIKSKPISIVVEPSPISQGMFIQKKELVGNFSITDSVHSKNVLVGKSVLYSVTIKGDGNTFSLQHPTIAGPNYTSVFLKSEHEDTIVNHTYYSKKVFYYQLIFSDSGTYRFEKTTFAFGYEKAGLHKYKLNLKSAIKVRGKRIPSPFLPQEKFYSNSIAIDISQSMKLEDYQPNRMGIVKTGVTQFLQKRRSCDIELIVFSGSAKKYRVMANDSCYSSYLINKIDFNDIQTKGTSIMEAVWLMINSNEGNRSLKRLAIIGDGDDNIGLLSAKTVADFAVQNNIKIYCIGIGHSGNVPFGKDVFGRQQMVSNTFQDRDLKKLSFLTGGKYFWAKDALDVTNYLRLIFP